MLRFFVPLAVQSASQSLSFLLVASIVSHGALREQELAAYAQGQSIIWILGAIGSGLVTTCMVFGRSRTGMANFLRLNVRVMAAALAMELLDDRLAALPVDPDRVYATGVSMGGNGVWDLLQRRPGFCAAAVPVCGGGDTNLASRLVSVPIRAFHGKADGIVPPFRSRSMVDAIRAAGGALAELDEYPGVGHDAWNRAYGDPSTLDWLFAQRKK